MVKSRVKIISVIITLIMKNHANNFGYMRVAIVAPSLPLGQPNLNASRILYSAKTVSQKGVSLIVYPELSICGYTLGDLLHQNLLQKEVLKALKTVAEGSRRISAVMIVGLPLSMNGQLYNTAAVISQGRIAGIIPKTALPNYREFYEKRWFASAHDLAINTVELLGQNVPVGTDILFTFKNIDDAVLGVEICEDLWMPVPPSSYQAIGGATIITNLSASNELVTKADYRRALVAQQSARCICSYLYVSSGVYESTTDVVYGGHAMIAENGNVLSESKRFMRDGVLIIQDIDLQYLTAERLRTTSFYTEKAKTFRKVELDIPAQPTQKLHRFVNPHPFVPQDETERSKRAEEIFAIQTTALARRMEHAQIKKILIGLSGGLDSTLALLVAIRVFKMLKIPPHNICAFTMPGFATSKRTAVNARKLAHALGITLEELNITPGVKAHLRELGHDARTQDLVFENAQARYRTMILMNKANMLKGLVIGTGDMSEIALGFNTFTGDHISHYNVNVGVPKTLVRYLVQYTAGQQKDKRITDILQNIIDTPISPELTTLKNKDISQKTEKILGPYELHDFFLYHLVRYGATPQKILFLASYAFKNKYSRSTLKKHLKTFLERFFANQWKRSVMPDGPKIGSVALSPRGDWRMPSDINARMWLDNLKHDK